MLTALGLLLHLDNGTVINYFTKQLKYGLTSLFLVNNYAVCVTLTKVVALPAAVVDHGAGHAAQRVRSDVEGLVQCRVNSFAV